MALEALEEVKSKWSCPKCGYEDYIGTIMACPVCDPLPEEEDTSCFFLDQVKESCTQDYKDCPFSKTHRFDECVKLEKPSFPGKEAKE